MMQQNTADNVNHTFLCVSDAIDKVCDEELVYEMLIMLHDSIQKDWSDFEGFIETSQYALAANILHGMKGTVPIFSDEKTEEIIRRTEVVLRHVTSESDLKHAVDDLRIQMSGFISELVLWVKMQQKIAI